MKSATEAEVTALKERHDAKATPATDSEHVELDRRVPNKDTDLERELSRAGD